MTATGAASIGARCVDTDSLSTHPISFQFGITLVTHLAYSCFWMNSTRRRKCCALFYNSPVGGAWNSSPMLFKRMFTCCQSMSIKSELWHCSANCIIAKRRLHWTLNCRAALATAMVVLLAKRIVAARVHVAASWQANCKLSVQPLITSHNQFFDLLTKFFLAPAPTINWYQKTSYRELMGLIYKGARSAANRRQKQNIWNPRGPA